MCVLAEWIAVIAEFASSQLDHAKGGSQGTPVHPAFLLQFLLISSMT